MRDGEGTTVVPQYCVDHFTDWYRASVDRAFSYHHPLLETVPGIAYKYDHALTPLVCQHRIGRRRDIRSFANLQRTLDRSANTLSQRERRDEGRRLGLADAWMASEFLGPHLSQFV